MHCVKAVPPKEGSVCWFHYTTDCQKSHLKFLWCMWKKLMWETVKVFNHIL